MARAGIASLATAATASLIGDRPNRLQNDGTVAAPIAIREPHFPIQRDPVTRIEYVCLVCGYGADRFIQISTHHNRCRTWVGGFPDIFDDSLLDDHDDRPVLVVSGRGV